MSLAVILDFLALGLFIYITTIFFHRRSSYAAGAHMPPMVPSFIPWLGHVFAFQFYRKDLFSECRARYGPTYKILLGGQHMVVVSSPKAIFEILSKSPKVLGPPKAQQYGTMSDITPERVPYVDHLSHQHFYGIATAGLSKNNVGPMALAMSQILFKRLHAALPAGVDVVTTSLEELVIKNFYLASTSSLFGSDEFEDSFDDFSTFDSGSFYALNGIPLVARPATRARRKLKDRSAKYILKAWDPEVLDKPDPDSTIVTRLIAALKSTELSLEETADIVTFCLWGFHSNLIRTAACTIAFLVRDAPTGENVAQHIRRLVERRWPDIQTLFEEEPHVILDDPDFAILDSVILETLRLASLPSSFRHVLSDTSFTDDLGNEYVLQKGEMVAVDVYGMHYDPVLFPNPESFKADRFVGAKTGLVKSLVPFGGGFLICRGRVYALYAIKMFLIQLFYLYDVTASSKDWSLSTNSITISDVMGHSPVHLRRRQGFEEKL
ncbi:hypothetical protein VNI00_003516 [Paramarasmius palmivorus]|uniref:Cytochrome P450 n=1 Tax=Paramarasmius palmivorus TaxID=297713 RepID=A0AAW0DV87_9AGAR